MFRRDWLTVNAAQVQGGLNKNTDYQTIEPADRTKPRTIPITNLYTWVKMDVSALTDPTSHTAARIYNTKSLGDDLHGYDNNLLTDNVFFLAIVWILAIRQYGGESLG